MNAPRQYVTEAGALQDLPIPAILKPLPPAQPAPQRAAADQVLADVSRALADATRVRTRRGDWRQELVSSYAHALEVAVRLRQCIDELDDVAPRS